MTASPALKVEAYEPALPGTVPGVGMSSIRDRAANAPRSTIPTLTMRGGCSFGEDLLVLAQAKAKAPLFAVWDGRRWDLETGGPCAVAIAQKLGGVGGAAAGAWSHMTPTPRVSKNTGAPKLTGAPISRRSGVAGQS